jgi:hypothetical protein
MDQIYETDQIDETDENPNCQCERTDPKDFSSLDRVNMGCPPLFVGIFSCDLSAFSYEPFHGCHLAKPRDCAKIIQRTKEKIFHYFYGKTYENRAGN